MEKEKQLIKNTGIITIGKIATQLVTFFLLPLYTFILSTEEYGIVDLLNNCVYLLIPLITFQIEQAIFRHLIEVRENEEEKRKIITTTIIAVLFQCMVYILLFVLISKFIHNDYKYFLATNVIATIFSSIMLQISRGLGDNVNYAIGSFISASGIIVFNVLFIVVFKFGAYGMLTANLIANLLCASYIFIIKKIYKYIDIKQFKKSILKKMLKYSIPLIPNALSWWIINSSNRVIVSSMISVSANGILATANKFSSVYITIYNIFNMAWTESASLYIDSKDRDEFFSNVTNVMLKLFSSICFGIIACMPFIFPIIINEKFAEAYNQIPILMLSSLCNVVLGLTSVVFIAKKNTKIVAKTTILSAIINIGTNLILIKFIGLYAASISTFLAYFVLMIYRYIDAKKYVNIKLEKNLVLKIFVISMILIICYYINNIFLNIISLIIAIIFALVINKKSIKFVMGFLKNRLGKI